MQEDLQFIYKEEFWYISSFLNSSQTDGHRKSEEIETLIKSKLETLTEDEIYRKELKNEILEMVKNVSINCKWISYLDNFPYKDENSDRDFNNLGYFQFEVEYYKDKPSKKESLKPMLIQQIPYILINSLKEYSNKPENKGLYLDTESPIYVFVTSNRIKPKEILWTQRNIEEYKKIIGYWTEIYSGQWEDYSEALYDRRIENNLSNRLSELHFIRRNSGFIYMAEENYQNFFESYMKEFVIDPTPKMRAVLFALRSINESLDSLFLKTQSEVFMDINTIETKIRNLRLLRGLIQTKLSLIYQELDYNRRQHYTRVLKHLLAEYEINNVISRINEKFNIIYDSIQSLYNKKNEENQQRTERGLNLLNLLFGAGILADLGQVLMLTFSLQEGDPSTVFLHSLIAIIITGILIATIIFYTFTKIQVKETGIGKAVDAIIEDGKGNIVLIKRKYPPFKDYYALPGGAIEKGEKARDALIREIKEETNLNIRIIKKIGVYDEPGRDPRGKIQSTAFKCSIVGHISDMKSGDDAKEVEFVNKERLKDIELAFDHRKMIKDADLLK
ncbi:MAG: NUDIX domain-containing protein [Promethearchaeota archaeon]